MLDILPSLFLSLSVGMSNSFFGVSPTPVVSPTPPTATVTSVVESPIPKVTPQPESNKLKYKIGMQVGHWKNHELPNELKVLRRNDGAHAGGKQEEEVNMAIVQESAKLLREQGIEVEILPATVPPDYKADAFITVHADGNPNPKKSGYKMSTSARDHSGKGQKLVELLENEYAKSTNLPYDPYITDNMKEYYSFAWWRFEHSIDPATPSAIVETGYLTNSDDREIIVKNPKKSAEGIAKAVTRFLNESN